MGFSLQGHVSMMFWMFSQRLVPGRNSLDETSKSLLYPGGKEVVTND